VQARIYGSRQKGRRRETDPPKPLDIDLAIKVHDTDPSQLFQTFWDARLRLQSVRTLAVEDLTNTASELYPDMQAGALIFARA
jgi:hypothetical protein